MIHSYLSVLEESLSKKIELLKEIEIKSKKQSEAFLNHQMSLAELDEIMDEKATLIEQITKLDEGFDSLYQKIKDELLENKNKYADQIKNIQKLIGEVTDLSTSIQTIEARNKQMVEQHFKEEKLSLKRQRTSSKVSLNYYKNMNNVNNIAPQFMDEKK